MLQLIIYREFFSKINNKSFKVMTFLSPILFVSMGLFIFYMNSLNDATSKKVAVVKNSKSAFEGVLENTTSLEFVYLSDIDLEAARILQEQQQFYGVLSISEFDTIARKFKEPLNFYSEESPSILFINQLEGAVRECLKEMQLQKLGLATDVFDFSNVVQIEQKNFEGDTSSKLSKGLRVGLGMGAGYLIMMFIVIYGTGVMRSVIEEKTSRIIEIVISSVQPFQLLLGKIIGNTLAGLLQFTIWGVFIFTIIAVLTSFFGVDVSATEIPIGQLQEYSEMQALLKEIFDLPLFSIFFFFIFR